MEITEEVKEKMKQLLRAGFQDKGGDWIRVRKVISRRNPTKTMFLGVVLSCTQNIILKGKLQ